MAQVLKNKMLTSRIKVFLELIRFPRPYGTLLLLFPTLWSLIIASQGSPSLKLTVVFCLGTFLMRSAGCVMNDLADQDLDRWVSRTRERPLPSHRISRREAWISLFLLLSLAASLLFFLNPFTRFLSLVGLGVTLLYPYAKRVTHLPQLVLGFAFAWGSIMAWSAVRNTIELPCILIFLATITWTMGYDTIYAMLDRKEDQKIGIKSTALLFGNRTWLALGALFGLTSIFLLLLGLQTTRTSIYYFSLLLMGFCFIYQIIKVKENPNPELTFILFKSHVGIGILVLVGILLDFWNQQQKGIFY